MCIYPQAATVDHIPNPNPPPPKQQHAAPPPTSIEVPAPPPVEKERNAHRQSVSGMSALGDEEVAGMEEVEL